MENFTPWTGLAGGIMIGGASALYLILAGRLSGISTMLDGALKPGSAEFPWRATFLAGLVIGAALVAALTPALAPQITISPSLTFLAAGGVIAGFGARLGGGCTSGHGVCGIPRLSIRSIVATAVFMATAAVTVMLLRHAIGIAV